ncbi:zinc transporter ZupT [Corynebacterium sp. SCR221107]|uniref:zinc transporter ZupT n=1 Tax=Corynebacterium sp. SCR221107 TaxID=3017361 RepID=UPI0022EC5FF1|nr:zinc transporter ZupT [Corynebacterium sp. SCR221107]WBT09681.1 zinc transporter ZupT [Corynebacterium sp. SCR221107]
MSAFLVAFGLTLLAGLSTGIGGAIAVAKARPGERFLAGSLGFSAGVMIYVSFVELLPEGQQQLAESYGDGKAQWLGVLAFFAGIAVIAIIDRLVPDTVNPHEPGSTDSSKRRKMMMQMGVVTSIAIAVHNFPEGFATFIAALADPTVAVPVAIAIAIHNIPEGIAVAVPLREATGSRAKAFGWSLVSGLAEPAGALIGYLLLLPWIGPATMGISFAMIAGVMVFISLDELLPTAVKTGRHHTAIYGLVAGMAVMAISLLIL